MLSNYFRIFFILASIYIAWNEVAAQIKTHGVKGSGVKGGRKIAPYNPRLFQYNFFRTSCLHNEEYTDCQIMEGRTCWQPDAFDSNYPCRSGCDCINGYLRNSKGRCVSKKQCDTIHKPINYVEPLKIYMKTYLTNRNTPQGVRPS